MLLILIGAQNFKAAFGLVFFIFGESECPFHGLTVAYCGGLGHLIATTAFPFFKLYGTSMMAF